MEGLSSLTSKSISSKEDPREGIENVEKAGMFNKVCKEYEVL